MPGPTSPPVQQQQTPTTPPAGSGGSTWWSAFTKKAKDKLATLGTPMGIGNTSPVPMGPAVTQGNNQPATYPVNTPMQAPQWWQRAKEKLNELGTPSGFGANAPMPFVPKYNQPATYNTGPAKPPYKRDVAPDQYNAGAPAALPPTGSFLAAGGDLAQGTSGAVSTAIPTGSVLAGGGDYVMGPNGLPYYMGTPGPNTFIAAGGEAMRGPAMSYAVDQPPAGGGGGGFGTSYDWWRKRKSGGGGGGYGYNDYGGGSDYRPAWQLGLNQWNYGE